MQEPCELNGYNTSSKSPLIRSESTFLMKSSAWTKAICADTDACIPEGGESNPDDLLVHNKLAKYFLINIQLSTEKNAAINLNASALFSRRPGANASNCAAGAIIFRENLRGKGV